MTFEDAQALIEALARVPDLGVTVLFASPLQSPANSPPAHFSLSSHVHAAARARMECQAVCSGHVLNIRSRGLCSSSTDGSWRGDVAHFLGYAVLLPLRGALAF